MLWGLFEEAALADLACRRTYLFSLCVLGGSTHLQFAIIAADQRLSWCNAMSQPPAFNHITPFVGRANEHSEITARLLQPECRLLTLTGLGGCGKTRLAIELAHTLA